MRWRILPLLVACGGQQQVKSPLDGATLVLQADRMIDVDAGKYVDNVTIAITGDTITYVGPRIAHARAIAVPVVMPGMIDAHVHLSSGDADAPRKTLHAGFTTVRELGSTDGAGIELRDAIAGGRVVGPRMIVSGAGIGSKGGACDVVFGGQGRIENAADAARVVDAQAAAGVDVIKICTGGGVLPIARDKDVVELDETMVNAIVDAAAKHRLRVAAHAQSPAAIAAAIRGGVVSIEHGGLIDDANATEMKARGVVLVPTLYRIDYTLSQLPPEGPRRALVVEGRELAFGRAKAAVAAGVTVALGTDAIVIPHGDNARELGALVEIGLTPAAAIRAATLDGAKLVGNDKLGRLRVGALADVVGVRGDPLADVTALREVVLVVKGGTIVHN